MDLQNVREFFVFAKHMSFTKAAASLNISQSGLNKHIRQLEEEIGVPLIVKTGKKFFLTPAGQLFLKKGLPQVDEFDKLIRECREVGLGPHDFITIREPTFLDLASCKVYKSIEIFRSETDATFHLAKISYLTPEAQIRKGTTDAHLIYGYGDESDIVNYFAGQGLTLIPLASEPLIVRCTSSHLLANRSAIEIDDLFGIPFLTPNQVFDPMREVAETLCKSRGFSPIFEVCYADSLTELAVSPGSDRSVFLAPQSVSRDIRFSSTEKMAFIPFAGDVRVNSFLLIGNRKSAILARFKEFMQSRM